MVFVMSLLLHQQASRLHISFWTRSTIPILFEITIPIPIGSHPSQCYSSRSMLKFKVPMEHNCENSKLTLLCWFRNMQITFLRAFRQYQNKRAGPTIWDDWYHILYMYQLGTTNINHTTKVLSFKKWTSKYVESE